MRANSQGFAEGAGAVTERYIDADELAAALGVSRRTVTRWVAAGCPSQTWGMRVRRFRISEVMAWASGADTITAQPAPPDLRNRPGTNDNWEVAQHGR
jgi:excisionase family DNA binding protein